jgi:hypothetical protein
MTGRHGGRGAEDPLLVRQDRHDREHRSVDGRIEGVRHTAGGGEEVGVGPELAPAALYAVPGKPDVNGARVGGGDARLVQLRPFELAAGTVDDDDVGPSEEPPQLLSIGRRVAIERDRLVPVPRQLAGRRRILAGWRRVGPHDVGTMVAEHHGRDRTRDALAQIQDAQIAEGPGRPVLGVGRQGPQDVADRPGTATDPMRISIDSVSGASTSPKRANAGLAWWARRASLSRYRSTSTNVLGSRASCTAK